LVRGTLFVLGSIVKTLWKKSNKAKVHLAAKRAQLIRVAIRESVDIEKVVKEWLNTNYTPDITGQQAREWARTHVHVNGTELSKALRVIYSESYVLGQDMGLSALAKARVNKAPSSMRQLQNAIDIDWNNWSAGNRAAARLLKPPTGLSTLLDSRGSTIQGLNATTKERIGTILADILKRGETPQTAVSAITEVLGKPSPERAKFLEKLGYDKIDAMLYDPERALTIAQTEMSRAVSVANRELYTETGVELVEWLIADPCDLCQENADVSPIRIDDTFPSGDTEPPAHPNCVCDLAPYVTDTRDIGEEALSFILGDEE